MDKNAMVAEPKAVADGVSVYCAHDAIVDVVKLVPNPKNPNTHPDNQIQLLGRIIRQTGWRAPITVSTRSGFIVKGHGRLAAALAEGMKEVPVDYQGYASESEEYADLVADNRLAELAEIDNKLLADIFAEIDTEEIPIEMTGFTEDEVEDIVNAMADALKTELTEPDDVPEVPEEGQAITEPGDIWLLGRHRLMCGDSTDQNAVAALMAGEKADMAFTDPPWNVNYGDKPRKILNDFMGTEDFKEFMYKAFASLNFAEKDGAMTYVVMSAQEWGNMMLTLAQNDFHWSSTIIWNKDSLVLSRKDYHTKYEPIWYGWKEGTRLCPLEDRKQSDVWDVPRPKKSEEHPTMKPVELVARAIANSSKPGDLVLDLFGGSGTTLMAAEQEGRKAALMELDPKYADVIVKRYIKATGDTDGVQLIRNGEKLGLQAYMGIFA